MLILLILLQVVPPMIAVLLYERFRKYRLTERKRIALGLIFAFFINMVGYAAMWLRGWKYHSWTLDGSSSMTGISFVLKYMAISLISAVAIPYVLCFIRVVFESEPGSEEEDEDEEEDDEDSEEEAGSDVKNNDDDDNK